MARTGLSIVVAAAIVVAGFTLPATAAAPPGYSTETPAHFFKRLFRQPTATNKTRAKKSESAGPPAVAPDTAALPDAAAVTPDAANVPLIDVPLPRLRPPDTDAPVAAAALGFAAPPRIAVPTSAMPEPHLRPNATPPTTLAALPPEPLTEEPLPPLVRPPPAATSACGAAIASLGVLATPLAPISEGDNGACQVAEPVAIASLDGGAVDLSGRAIVDCPLAETLADWVRTEVEPAATAAYGEALTGLRIVDSYSCRTRDNIEGAKMSEHARGNAIDIAAFRIGKRWIEVGPGWQAGGADLAFLTAVRKSACGPFKTVLGPGADSFHTDHFHLDLEKRRTSGPSKGIVCE